MQKLPVKEFFESIKGMPILDVRSPGEYLAGHIPGAFSFPIFSDEERAIVGTLYKNEGNQVAIDRGLEIVEPKAVNFIEDAETLNSTSLALYCWRGGMRSESMAWLLEHSGFKIKLLQGGYKAYRTCMIDFFNQDLPLKVITGYTGSKKTELLHLLAQNGEQIIDLEGLARHQGSSFGNQKTDGQPSTEQFQNLLYESFKGHDLSKTIWIEDECMRIGRVNLPEALYDQLNRSDHIFVDIEKSQRVDFLLEDYGTLSKDQLVEATYAIRKKLGSALANEAIDCITNGQGQRAAEIVLTYYDKRYYQSIVDKEHLISHHLKVNMNELPELAIKLAGKQTYAV